MDTTKVLPEIGTTVIAKYIPHVTGSSHDYGCTDQEIVVTKVQENRYTWDNAADEAAGAAKNMPAVYGMFKRADRSDVEYFVTDWEVVTPSTDPLHSELALIRTQFNDLEIRHREMRNQATRAIENIGDRLNREAEERDWCGVFDAIVETVNEQNPSWLALPLRTREYTLTKRVSVDVDIQVTVEAVSLSDAIERANDDDIGSLVSEAVRYGNYNINEDDSDWEED